MSKLLVTGATGELGGATVKALLQRVDAGQIVALARDPAKVDGLGVEVRRGDYLDLASLIDAFEGVQKVLLVSAVAFTDGLTQHINVINAAKAAGVKHLVYTSIQRKEGSSFEISMVTESDIATERALIDSGLIYTILRNTLYLDVLPLMLGADVMELGVRMTDGQGKAPMVARADLAEANAVVLSEPGHDNRIYTLGASEAFSFTDVASELSMISARPVTFIRTSNAQFADRLISTGFPKAPAEFMAEWSRAVSNGEFEQVTGDLERLIGREPVGYKAFLEGVYGGSS
jgi:NAD(P)H dehydrogenase (quinone)